MRSRHDGQRGTGAATAEAAAPGHEDIGKHAAESPLFSSSRTPSRETIRFVLASCGKAAFVQTVMLVVMLAIAYVVGAVSGSESATGVTRNVLFNAYQVFMISVAAVEVFLSGVKTQQAAAAGSQPPMASGNNDAQSLQGAVDPDEARMNRIFHMTILGALVAPFLFLYWRSEGTATDLAICLFTQWAAKAVCFVTFPREILTVGG
ncbi:Hypothetical Protein FCC1311_083022 [Hondaea fermentalgiana]|uniref:Uncharacterized protein n=1 Tax=Hondaea fermentalgiana TaxID=2315210 RepID=A0A2R5GMG5_9STRA|nr:Hypothetical Protein FCC1311_083022 [Hondaea fermentalgiana]|eukprot:GBG32077.1 Hypothetical Protein FCC1311_083022 [Hondaea fermentalgiana]